jgi:thiol-disulfide isomerase/thioredoxin
VAALALASAFGFAWRARNGRLRERSRPQVGEPALSPADLGQPLGARATLLQFSSAFCAPCRATRQILGEVAGMVDGVAHVEIDAESRLDLVRRLDVLRTPTMFVLGPDGQITHRASGQPRKAEVIAAIGTVVVLSTFKIGNNGSDTSDQGAYHRQHA